MIRDMDTIHSQMLASKIETTKKTPDPKDEKALMEACAGFESIFTKTLMDSMRATLPGDALFEKSNGRKIFESLHDQHLAEEVSQAPHGYGIKEFLYNQLKDAL